MKRVLAHIHRAIRPGDGESFPRVHSAKKFASILNRERDRTDRTGQEFSMVVFDTGNASRRSAAVRSLVSFLARRIHSTDDIGWLEDGRIAVALPHTPPEGAWKFVDSVKRALGGSAPCPDCTVYVYPSRWITRADGVSCPPPNTQTTPSQPAIPFPKTGDPGFETRSCSRPMEELDSHFLRPIPFWKRAIDIVVADRPSFAAFRAKGISMVHRIGVAILALSLPGSHWK